MWNIYIVWNKKIRPILSNQTDNLNTNCLSVIMQINYIYNRMIVVLFNGKQRMSKNKNQLLRNCFHCFVSDGAVKRRNIR